MTNALLRSPFVVGFERLLDEVDKTMTQTTSYPPHDIIKSSETSYKIVIAVAGFTKTEIKVSVQGNKLSIVGQKIKSTTDDVPFFIYNGISNRAFTKSFTLSDNVKVTGAKVEDGLLTVSLERLIPESQKLIEVAIN